MRKIFFLGAVLWFPPVLAVAQGNSSRPSTVDGRSLLDSGGLSNSQIADAIRRSGLTQDQIRARLQAAGFNPKLADQYFQGGVAGNVSPADAASRPDAGFASALRALGLLDADAQPSDSVQSDTLSRPGARIASGSGPSGKVWIASAV